MTRKDYEAIAAALAAVITENRSRDAFAQAYKNGAIAAADNIADVMARDNPRFDRARFLKACGVQS